MGAGALLARATNKRSLTAATISTRLRAVAEKYILKHDPDADGTAISSFLNGLHADDLLLVVACEDGDQTAWTDLFEGYGATVRSAARAASSNEAMADDLAQSIWAELHGLKLREDGTPAGKLGYYSGAGWLGGWVGAVVGQLAIGQHREQAKVVQTEEDSDLDRLALEGDADGARVFHTAPSPEVLLTQNLASAAVEK